MFDEEYFNFLCEYVMVIGRKVYSYYKICRDLHQMSWYPVIPEDEDRRLDALSIRQLYFDMTGRHPRVENDPSMLEFMVYLARKMAYIMDDGSEIDSSWYYFIIILKNLGLNSLVDTVYVDDAKALMVGKMEDAVNRNYDFSGFGGFFPLRRAKKDQRKVGIWFQLNAWLIENNDLSV